MCARRLRVIIVGRRSAEDCSRDFAEGSSTASSRTHQLVVPLHPVGNRDRGLRFQTTWTTTANEELSAGNTRLRSVETSTRGLELVSHTYLHTFPTRLKPKARE